MTIADLDKIVASLTPNERRLFQRIFQFGVVSGRLRPPPTMHPWIEKHFGAVKEVAEQRVVKVTNVITFEGALFNMLRGRRPMDVEDGIDIGDRVLEEEDHPCLLQDAMRNTPEDTFGRVKGESCITASNVAKYDAFHGLVVFQEHNPLRFSREAIIDYLETGWRWAEKAHELDSSAKYYFFIWNCLWKAGASLVHGHAQVLLSHDTHYAKIEALRRAALRYRAEYGSSYFEDLYRVHLSLGLGLEREGVRIIASLSPIKDKEIILLGQRLDLSLEARIYEVLACLRDHMHVTSFNLALATPPLGDTDEDWTGFPVLVRIVDRGDLKSAASDIGAMELYASSVISSDPFEVARLLKGCSVEEAT
jgi:hypothetical protein